MSVPEGIEFPALVYGEESITLYSSDGQEVFSQVGPAEQIAALSVHFQALEQALVQRGREGR